MPQNPVPSVSRHNTSGIGGGEWVSVLLRSGRRELLFERGPMFVAETVGEGIDVDMMPRTLSRWPF